MKDDHTSAHERVLSLFLTFYYSVPQSNNTDLISFEAAAATQQTSIAQYSTAAARTKTFSKRYTIFIRTTPMAGMGGYFRRFVVSQKATMQTAREN